MGKLSIYLDQASLNRIRLAAAREKISISSWAKNQLDKHLKDEWPPGYWQLFGSLNDQHGMQEPPELDWNLDCPREQL